MSTWALTVTGLALVVVALRDVFHTLWHPRGVGSLCRLLFRAVWWLVGRTSRSSELAGPLGLLTTATAWGALVVAGCALVYLPHMPSGFFFGSSLQPAASSDVVASLYLSLVSVATLGLGDILPASGALRVLVPLEALIGFVLLTAVISWVLQIYPALTRRRALARRLVLLARTRAGEVVTDGDASVATQLLDSITDGITTVEMDLSQYGESYYFREQDADISLAATLPLVPHLVAAGRHASATETRHAAAVLDRALESLCETLRGHVPRRSPEQGVLEAFARDHGHRPIAVPPADA